MPSFIRRPVSLGPSLVVHLLTLVVITLLESEVVECDVRCMDNAGNPVDWFVVIKLPKLASSSSAAVRKGVGQLYMDVNNQRWTPLEQGIDAASSHAVYNTLQQIYTSSGSQDIAYVMYNDETPAGKTSYSYGHTKGDVCFDKSSGFWLVHSVPKFPPPIADGYSYPPTGHKYGQSFLCVTYGYARLNDIGKQFLYNYPQIYDSSVPEAFSRDNVDLSEALQHKHITASPWSHYAALSSEAGQQFASFAKFSSYGQDLYDGWLAPHFQADFSVETWQNGPGPLPSNCSIDYKVENVEVVSILGNSYSHADDHSKWAVTADDKDWICVGDINRAESQKNRAGGTLCGQLPGVAKAFRAAINSAAYCPKRNTLTAWSKSSMVESPSVRLLLISLQISWLSCLMHG